MVDYSKFDKIMKDEDAWEVKEKDRLRQERQDKYFKTQEERQAKYSQDHAGETPMHNGHTGHSCGCSVMDPEKIKAMSEEKKRTYMPVQERNKLKFEAIRAAKTDGNSLFKKGDLDTAFAVYERGSLICNGVTDVSDSEFEVLSELEMVLDLNMAAVRLKQERWLDAINHCKMALNIRQNCVKAIYRHAEAYIGMSEYKLAQEQLDKAKEIQPDNPLIDSKILELHQLIRREQEKERKFERGMRGRLL